MDSLFDGLIVRYNGIIIDNIVCFLHYRLTKVILLYCQGSNSVPGPSFFSTDLGVLLVVLFSAEMLGQLLIVKP